MMMEPIVAPKVFRPRHPLRGEKRSKLELNLVTAGRQFGFGCCTSRPSVALLLASFARRSGTSWASVGLGWGRRRSRRPDQAAGTIPRKRRDMNNQITGERDSRRGKDRVVQTEPNGTDKPLPRIGPKGSGAVHGGEAAKPGQLPGDEDVGPKD